MPEWLKNPVEGGQGGSAPLRTSFSDEEKLSSANLAADDGNGKSKKAWSTCSVVTDC